MAEADEMSSPPPEGAAFRKGDRVRVKQKFDSPAPDGTSKHMGKVGEVIGYNDAEGGGGSTTEVEYRVKMPNKAVIILPERHLLPFEEPPVPSTSASESRAAAAADREAMLPRACLRKNTRVVVFRDVPGPSKNIPSLHRMRGSLAETPGPNSRNVKVKFDVNGRTYKVEIDALQLLDPADDPLSGGGDGGFRGDDDVYPSNDDGSVSVGDGEGRRATGANGSAAGAMESGGEGDLAVNDPKADKLMLSSLDPDSWISKKVRFVDGRHQGTEGLVLGAGNGWVQLRLETGAEVSGRAYSLEVIGDASDELGMQMDDRSTEPDDSAARAMDVVTTEEEGADEANGGSVAGDNGHGNRRTSLQGDEDAAAQSATDAGEDVGSIADVSVAADVVAIKPPGRLSRGVSLDSLREEEPAPMTHMMGRGRGRHRGRRGRSGGAAAAAAAASAGAAGGGAGGVGGEGLDGLALLAGSSAHHAIAHSRLVEQHAEQVKKHVERHLERYKDRPPPSTWLAQIRELANSDSELEDEHEWQDALEANLCAWCGSELAIEDQFCWSRDCPASPIFQDPPSEHAGLPWSHDTGGEQVAKIEVPPQFTRRRYFKLKGFDHGRWTSREDYPELAFLAHRPARPTDHAYYNTHAMVKIVDLRKRKRGQQEPSGAAQKGSAAASKQTGPPAEFASLDPPRYRWQVTNALVKDQQEQLAPAMEVPPPPQPKPQEEWNGQQPPLTSSQPASAASDGPSSSSSQPPPPAERLVKMPSDGGVSYPTMPPSHGMAVRPPILNAPPPSHAQGPQQRPTMPMLPAAAAAPSVGGGSGTRGHPSAPSPHAGPMGGVGQGTSVPPPPQQLRPSGHAGMMPSGPPPPQQATMHASTPQPPPPATAGPHPPPARPRPAMRAAGPPFADARGPHASTAASGAPPPPGISAAHPSPSPTSSSSSQPAPPGGHTARPILLKFPPPGFQQQHPPQPSPPRPMPSPGQHGQAPPPPNMVMGAPQGMPHVSSARHNGPPGPPMPSSQGGGMPPGPLPPHTQGPPRPRGPPMGVIQAAQPQSPAGGGGAPPQQQQQQGMHGGGPQAGMGGPRPPQLMRPLSQGGGPQPGQPHSHYYMPSPGSHSHAAPMQPHQGRPPMGYMSGPGPNATGAHGGPGQPPKPPQPMGMFAAAGGAMQPQQGAPYGMRKPDGGPPTYGQPAAPHKMPSHQMQLPNYNTGPPRHAPHMSAGPPPPPGAYNPYGPRGPPNMPQPTPPPPQPPAAAPPRPQGQAHGGEGWMH